MKRKTINKILDNKFEEWCASIEDTNLRELVRKNTIITGGAIASMLLNEPVNDYDVYFRTWETNRALAEYYLARFSPKNRNGIPCSISLVDADTNLDPVKGNRIKIVIKSAGIASEDGAQKEYQYFESRPEGEASHYVSEVMRDAGEIEDTYDQVEQGVLQSQDDDGKPAYRPVFMSSNAITLSQKIQIVIRFWGDPEELHENYDFVHCTNYWTSWDRKVELKPDAMEALLSKELRYVGSKYPLCSIMRLRKFIKRGWSVNAGQILKAIMQLNALDLLDPKVLEDQLTGVDSAYFAEVIQKLSERNPEKIETAYLIEIIDRMF